MTPSTTASGPESHFAWQGPCAATALVTTPTSSSSAPARRAPATAYHLAQAGLDVLLLEKTAFPREKVCGDGLTPRAVKQLVAMGIDTRRGRAGMRNKGLRIVGGGHRLELPWPDLATYPPLRPGPHPDGLRRDPRPARRRRPAPGCTSAPPSPARSSTSAPAGSSASPRSRSTSRGRRAGDEVDLPRAGRGRRRRRLRPARHRARPASAARTARWASPSAPTTRARATTTTGWSPGSSCGTASPAQSNLLPGYGWIFGVGDGTANVGLGILNTSNGVPERRLQGPAAGAGSRTRRRSGASATRTWSARSAAPRCRWASTASRTTPAACCSSATPAAWSTRSTARASPTPWSPGEMAAEVVVQALGPRRRSGARAGPRRATRAALDGDVRRLLHARPGLREDDRQPDGHEAGHEARPAAPDADEFTLKLLANLTDPRGGDAIGPDHQRAGQGRPGRLTGEPDATRRSPARPADTASDDADATGGEQRRELYVPSSCSALLAGGFAVVLGRGQLADRARSATTGPSSTPTSAASSRPRSRSAAAGSR